MKRKVVIAGNAGAGKARAVESLDEFKDAISKGEIVIMDHNTPPPQIMIDDKIILPPFRFDSRRDRRKRERLKKKKRR